MSLNEVTEPARRGGIPRGHRRDGIALFSYGFRPFFLGAGIWAVVAMVTWIGALTFGWQPGGGYGALNWHAHEMLFGYTSAALAGFMLTAIPNWTGRLPVSGVPLAVLFLLWLAGRIAMAFPLVPGLTQAMILDALFFPLLAIIAAREISAGQNWRNLHVIAALSLLTAANIWFHYSVAAGEDTGTVIRLTISVWLMLISLIGGRLAVSFTHNWLARKGKTAFPVSLGRFDQATLVAGLVALTFWTGWPESHITGLLCLLAASLHLVRLIRWQGWRAWQEPLVLVLHTSYAFIPLGFAGIGAATIGMFTLTSALHLLTVGAIANMTMAVMTRAGRGHTGHQLEASLLTTTAYACLVMAALLRPLVDVFPELYQGVLVLSAGFWIGAYSLFVLEYAPMLLRRRKENLS